MSFATPHRQRSGPAIPMAAMVDILFLLLVFFITISHFREAERTDRLFETNPPGARTGDRQHDVSALYITIGADGSLAMNRQEHSLQSLRNALAVMGREFPEERVIVRADREVPTGHLIRIVDMAREKGFFNVGLAVEHDPDTPDDD